MELHVAGVPEHFNLPWQLAQERGLFDKHGVKVVWHSAPLGTGYMISGLKEGKFDVIVALTEGLIADIAKGSDLKLLATYVESPLTWAISCGKNAPYNCIEDLRGQKFGVSRFGSGSHLMAILLALQRGWDLSKDISFEVKGDFASLRNSVNDGSTAAFMWETFMTKPFYDPGESQEVKKIGEITTPWPCFMVASRQSIIDAKFKEINAALAAVREACLLFHVTLKDEIPQLVAKRFGLKLEDAKEWYSGVTITASRNVAESHLERALSLLEEAAVIPPTEAPLKNLYDSRFVDLQISIKNMKLYNKPELVIRTYNELRAAGLAKGKLNFKDLIPFDQQHHYNGVDAVEKCIQECNISENSNVISLGSGLGGPARYIAGTTNCQVLALELQDDLHATAKELTERCGLESKVHHVCGDFLQIAQHLRSKSYTVIASWLTILHIPNREKLFSLCADLVKPGGSVYLEDFFERNPLTDTEKQILAKDVFCPYLPDLETYKQHLVQAGFKFKKVEDLTDEWREYTKQRVESFEKKRDSFVRLHGEDTYQRLLYFYTKVRDLFAGGNLGGVRIVAEML